MKKIILILIAGILIFSIPSFADNEKIAEHSIHLRGSGTVMGMLQNAAEAYMKGNPGATVSVSGGGTDRGIKSLIDGTCQIAMASTEANSELTNRAAEEGVGLAKHVIAYDAIVPFVHPDNPVSNLTIEQLKGIYTGEIKNWKDVGGNDSGIVLTTRSLSSGTYEGFKLLVMGEDSILPKGTIAMDSIPERIFVAKNSSAIGYCALNYIDNTIKPLIVDDIPANPDTITNGSFPLKRDLFLYTRDDAPTYITEFIEYVKKNAAAFAQVGVFPTK